MTGASHCGGPAVATKKGITLLILTASSVAICSAVYVPGGSVVMIQLWDVPVS